MTLKFDSNTARFRMPVYLAWVVCTGLVCTSEAMSGTMFGGVSRRCPRILSFHR